MLVLPKVNIRTQIVQEKVYHEDDGVGRLSIQLLVVSFVPLVPFVFF